VIIIFTLSKEPRPLHSIPVPGAGRKTFVVGLSATDTAPTPPAVAKGRARPPTRRDRLCSPYP